MSFSQKDCFTLSSLNRYQPATIVMQYKGIVYKAFWKRRRKVGQREPTLQHVFWRGKPIIRAVAQKQDSTNAQQRTEQRQPKKKCNSFKNFTSFYPQNEKITWSKFPEVIEVSIQMSIVPSKYIQVSIVGNCTQKKVNNEHFSLQKQQTMKKCNTFRRICVGTWSSAASSHTLWMTFPHVTGGTCLRVQPCAWKRSFSFTIYMNQSCATVSTTKAALSRRSVKLCNWFCSPTNTELQSRRAESSTLQLFVSFLLTVTLLWLLDKIARTHWWVLMFHGN